MNANVSASRSVLRAIFVGLIVTLTVAVPGRLAANPIPEAAVFVHVQPEDPDACDNPLLSCDDIVQYTDASGVLEFDVYLSTSMVWPLQVSSLQVEVEWPEAWDLIDYVACGGAMGEITVSGSSALLDLQWPDCPIADGDVFLAARFVLNVTENGDFRGTSFEPSAMVGCPPDEMPVGPMPVSAEAGVECSYCWTACDFDYVCRPTPSEELVQLELHQGEVDDVEISVFVMGDPDWPCWLECVGTESWMAVEDEVIDYYWHKLTLTVDTAGLEPGFYDGWVEIESTCMGCTKVILEVLPEVNSVPGEDPATVETTWGKLKDAHLETRR